MPLQLNGTRWGFSAAAKATLKKNLTKATPKNSKNPQMPNGFGLQFKLVSIVIPATKFGTERGAAH